jgi:NAD-dependent deacetylase
MWSNCTGTLWIWRCVRCGQDREDREVPLKEHPPKCASGGNRRPAVVWFWEELPAKALGRSYRALEACDLFFAIGPSAVVQPAPSFLDMARMERERRKSISPPLPSRDWPTGQSSAAPMRCCRSWCGVRTRLEIETLVDRG